MPTETARTELAAAPPIVLCDRSPTPTPATHAYTWEWGANGVCCAAQIPVLQQTAKQLKRGINFMPLSSAEPVRLTRDERTQLIAAKLSAEAEIDELKLRGLELYRQNTQLTQQVQSLSVRHREAEAQLKDAKAVHDEREKRLVELEAENADLSDELGRLRVLIGEPAPGAERTRVGLEGQESQHK